MDSIPVKESNTPILYAIVRGTKYKQINDKKFKNNHYFNKKTIDFYRLMRYN